MNIEIVVTNHHSTHIPIPDGNAFSARVRNYAIGAEYGRSGEEAIGKLILKLVREEMIHGIDIPDWLELT